MANKFLCANPSCLRRQAHRRSVTQLHSRHDPPVIRTATITTHHDVPPRCRGPATPRHAAPHTPRPVLRATMLVRTFHTSSRARGARRTRLATAPGSAPREDAADPDAAQLPPVTGRASEGRRCAPGRRLPLLGPPGHGGIGARAVPRPPALAGRRNDQRQARELQSGHPPRRSSVKPGKISCKGA